MSNNRWLGKLYVRGLLEVVHVASDGVALCGLPGDARILGEVRFVGLGVWRHVLTVPGAHALLIACVCPRCAAAA